MIAVIGSKGQLGRAVLEAAASRGIPFVAADRDTVDASDRESVVAFLADHPADCIINCAAYTAVDAAEDHPAEAYAANAMAPWVLAQTGLPVIHVSTDYVFDGNGTSPYAADAPCHPVSVYGLTKRAGETALLESGARGVIVRTAWVYSSRPGTRNFFHTIRRLASEREEINVVADQVGAPTLAEDLAEALLTLLERREHLKPMHLLHFTNSGSCSWHEFASEIVRGAGTACRINPIPTSGYPTRAKRPAYSVLSLEEIRREAGIVPRHWLEALRDAESRTHTDSE